MEENQYSVSFYSSEGTMLDAFLRTAYFKLQNTPVKEVLSPSTQQMRKPRLRGEVAYRWPRDQGVAELGSNITTPLLSLRRLLEIQLILLTCRTPRVSWGLSPTGTELPIYLAPSLNDREDACLGPLYSDAVPILGKYPWSFSYSVTCFIVLVFSRSHRIDPWPHALLRNLLVAIDSPAPTNPRVIRETLFQEDLSMKK